MEQGVVKDNGPGRVFIVPISKAGRRKNFGTMAVIEGIPSMCLGYSPDGKLVVYMPMKQLKRLKDAARAAGKGISFKVLSFINSRYPA